MNRTETELWERLRTVAGTPYGLAKIAAAEEVIRHADAQGFAEIQFAARMTATTAYTYGGEPAKAFMTFAWCLATYDRDGGYDRHEYDLHWHFKWMVSAMTNFPDIPLDRTHAALDDMERRYRLAGHDMNPVHQHREMVARHVGDRALAEEQYRLWSAAPRGAMADCAGCEPTTKVNHLAWSGRDEDAVAIAVPVLDGSLDCYEQPHAILTSLLMPYLRTGRLVEAADAHRRAYRAIQSNRAELSMLARHLEFCARTGNHARGLELVERHLGWLAAPPSPGAELRFAAAAALVLRQVVEAGHGDTPVRRPSLDGAPATVVPAAALHDELAARSRALAARFDVRNGTSTVSERTEATLAAAAMMDQLPLSGLARRAARHSPPVAEQVLPELPDSPAELVALAREEANLGNAEAKAAVWRRFDEVCPDPEPALAAPRLFARALDVMESDAAEAERLLVRAGALYGEAGEPVRQAAMRGHVGVLWCRNGRAEEGVAEAVASVEALAEIGTDEDRAAGYLRLGMAYEAAARRDDSHDAYVRALASAAAARAELLVGDAAFVLAQLESARGTESLAKALEYANRAVTAYGSVPGCAGLSYARMFAGRLHAAMGDFDAARPLLVAAQDTTDLTLRGEVLALHGQVALDMGLAEEACDLLAGAVAAVAAAGEPTGPVTVDFADAALRVDRANEAAEALEEVLAELSGPQGNHARFLLAKAYRALGQAAAALPLCDEVGDFCAADGNPAGVGQMHAMAGAILDELDRDDEAAERFTSAATSFAEAGIELEVVANWRRAAVSWWWIDENDRSLAALAAADAAAAASTDDTPAMTWQQAMLSYDAARILANLEQAEDALSRAVTAAAGFRAVRTMDELAAVTVLQGRLLVDLERVDEAKAVLTGVLDDLPDSARDQVTSLLASIS